MGFRNKLGHLEDGTPYIKPIVYENESKDDYDKRRLRLNSPTKISKNVYQLTRGVLSNLKENGITDPLQKIPLEFLRDQLFNKYRTGLIPESTAQVIFRMFINQNPGILI